MRKKNFKPMIISALLAIGFGATSIGTTFALFTDYADTTINVTAGKVDVSSALTVEAVSSLNSGDTGNVVANDKLSATLSQGGAVTVNNDGTVSIDRMIPGDRVVLKMTNENASNVAIKHRVTTSSASFVFDGNTKVADTSNYKLGEKLTVKFYSDADCAEAHLVAKPDKWSNPVNPSADPLSTYYIEVAFPDGDNGAIKFGDENADNIYQNKAADFAFSLEAVQGNAVTASATTVTSTVELQAALDALEENDEEAVIRLAAGNYGDVVIQAGENIGNTVVQEDAAHNTSLSQTYEFDYRFRSLSNVKIEGGEGVYVRSIRLMSGRCGVTKGYNYVPQNPDNDEWYTFDGLEAKNITIKGINFNGAGVYVARGYNTYDWAEMIAGTQDLGAIENITVDSCTFEPDWNNGAIPSGYFYRDHMYGGVHVQTNHWDNGSGEEYVYCKNITIKNNTFKNILGVAGNIQDTTAINLQDVEGAIAITGNTFTNTYFNHIQMNSGFKHLGTIAITGNTFGDNHDRMLRFNSNYSGLTAFNLSGNYFDLTSTAETSGPYGKSSVTNLNTTYFADGKLPFGANYWKDSTIEDWTTTATLNGFSINNADQTYYA